MSLSCLNGAYLIFNQTSNESYCQCHPCYQGVNCADLIPRKHQTQFDTAYIYLLIYITALCLALLNNLSSLEVFLGSVYVRRTNIGVYLILYSITSIVGSVILVINQSIQYYKPAHLANDAKLFETLDCLLKKTGDQVASFLCLWLSAFVALERALIMRSTIRMNASRCRAICVLIFGGLFATATIILMLIYRCEWDVSHSTPKARLAIRWFYTAAFLAGLIYFISMVLVLTSFVSHIHCYAIERQSKWQIFRRLLKKHMFVFIPSITYLLCVIPYQIWYPINRLEQPYLQCGISAVEYAFKIIVQYLPSLPMVLTWLIFVYPSNVYMTEFYTNTWSGKRLWQILIYLRVFNQSSDNKTNIFIDTFHQQGHQQQPETVIHLSSSTECDELPMLKSITSQMHISFSSCVTKNTIEHIDDRV